MKPLFVVCSRRVYRPEECPPDVQEKACQRESEHVDSDFLTDSLRECFSDELESHGLRFKGPRGPYWGLYSQGSGVGVELVCDDVAKYCAARKITSEHVQALAESGHLSLTSRTAWCNDCLTVAESEDTLRGDDPPAWSELAQRIGEDWTDYVRGLAQRMHESVEADYEYQTSWPAVKESAEANGYGFDPEGRIVNISECEERDSE